MEPNTSVPRSTIRANDQKKMLRDFLEAPRPLDMRDFSKKVGNLGASTRLRPTGSSRYLALNIFAFVQQCIIILINPDMMDCPSQHLEKASHPLWETLHPREILEWETLTKLLKEDESTPIDSITETTASDAAFWQKLQTLSSKVLYAPKHVASTTRTRNGDDIESKPLFEAQTIGASTNLPPALSQPTKHDFLAGVKSHGTIHRLPLELLHQILAYAASPDYDEFGYEATFEAVPSSGAPPTYISTDEVWVFKDRLHIAMVCKLWYKIGIRFLWSHLSLTISWWKRHQDHFPNLLLREPTLCTYIIRLDLSYSFNETASFEELDPVEHQTPSEHEISTKLEFTQFVQMCMYPHLSNLQLLCSDYSLANIDGAVSPTITYLFSEGKEHGEWDEVNHVWDGGSYLWRHTRMLELDLEGCLCLLDDNSRVLPVSLSRLEELTLKNCEDPGVIEQINSSWNAPLLHTLVVYVKYADLSVDSLRWASKTLVNLSLSSVGIMEGTPVEFPILRTLVLQNCFTKRWKAVIDAPALTNILFEDHAADRLYTLARDRFAHIVANTLAPYPSCKSITFYRSYQVDYEFSFDPSDKVQLAEAIKNQWVWAAAEGA
ncbi:hypothetical protein CPB86DRAFT_362004 [Serendipita vermifera]|nr:hypothetical protein CPB86DRAFT_362004 [Serendipita vermifera]